MHTSTRLACLRFATLVIIAGCGGGGESASTTPTTPTAPTTPVAPATPVGPVGPLVVGQTYTDENGWLEYVPGNAPLVIIAPHGGSLAPSALPDRVCAGCVTVNDANTQELAREIIAAFERRTGAKAHLVVNRLSRRKFDANRDMGEATGGTIALQKPWAWLHAAVDSAKDITTKRHGRGLVIDLHGHAHAVARLELGYLLSESELRQSDATLTASSTMLRSSIAKLSTDSRSTTDRGVPMLRGPFSLGTLLASAGFPSVPSAQDPAPKVGEEYFNGGFNTQRHGSVQGGALDAIQIECNFAGVRDAPNSRAAFATALANALAIYFERHYGWKSSP